MAKGHVYHHKASEDGCAKRGCMTVLGKFLSHLRFVAAGQFLRALHRSGKHREMLPPDKGSHDERRTIADGQPGDNRLLACRMPNSLN